MSGGSSNGARRMMEKAASLFEDGNRKNAYAQYIAVLSSLIYKLSSSKVSFGQEGGPAKFKQKDLLDSFQLAHECLYASENILQGRSPGWRPTPNTPLVQAILAESADIQSTTTATIPLTAESFLGGGILGVGSIASSVMGGGGALTGIDPFISDPDLLASLDDINDEDTLPLIPLSPLCRMYILNTRRLVKATREHAQAKKPPKDPRTPAVPQQVIKRLEEDVKIQRAKVDEVNTQIHAVEDRTLTHWEVDELARELCSINAGLFAKVDVRRDLMSQSRLVTSDSVRVFGEAAEACVDFERYVTSFVTHLLIISYQDRNIEQTIIKLIRVIARVKGLYRDYNAFAALTRALAHGAVVRLPRLWERIPRKLRDLIQGYSKLLDSTRMYSRYMVDTQEALDERQLELSGAEAMAVVPWMRAHVDNTRAILRTFTGSNGALNETGQRRLEMQYQFLERCQQNANGRMSTSAQAAAAKVAGQLQQQQQQQQQNQQPQQQLMPPPRKQKRKTFVDVDGQKILVVIPVDLQNLPQPNFGLQHWMLSQPFLSRLQLWEESAQQKSMFRGESQALVQREAYRWEVEVLEPPPPVPEAPSSWRQTVTVNVEPPALKIEPPSSPQSVLSVDGFIDFLDESLLNIRGMHQPVITPLPSPALRPIPSNDRTLEDEAMENVMNSLKPEFNGLLEELEQLRARREERALMQRFERVQQEVENYKSSEPRSVPISPNVLPNDMPVQHPIARSSTAPVQKEWIEFPISPEPAALGAELALSRPITPQMMLGTLAAELMTVSRTEGLKGEAEDAGSGVSGGGDQTADALRQDLERWLHEESHQLKETERQAKEATLKAEETAAQFGLLREQFRAIVASPPPPGPRDDDDQEIEDLIKEMTKERLVDMKLRSPLIVVETTAAESEEELNFSLKNLLQAQQHSSNNHNVVEKKKGDESDERSTFSDASTRPSTPPREVTLAELLQLVNNGRPNGAGATVVGGGERGSGDSLQVQQEKPVPRSLPTSGHRNIPVENEDDSDDSVDSVKSAAPLQQRRRRRRSFRKKQPPVSTEDKSTFSRKKKPQRKSVSKSVNNIL